MARAVFGVQHSAAIIDSRCLRTIRTGTYADAGKGLPADTVRAKGDDWESAALQRVGERHAELHHASGDGPLLQGWEQRAVECLRRYFRSPRG